MPRIKNKAQPPQGRLTPRAAEPANSEHRTRAILSASIDAIITIDTNGIIETFSAVAEKMFGYAATEAIGRNVSMLMASPYREQHENYLRRYARTHEPRVIGRLREFRARRKDGTEFPIRLSVSEIPDLGLFTGVVRDVSRLHALQEEIVRVATVEQRRIGEELHDGTLQELTGLGLLARNLADALDGPTVGRERELAEKIAAGIAEANRRVRALAQGLVPVPVDPEDLMSALASLTRHAELEHGLSCSFICPEPVQITDDSTALHLYRIVQEALTNAIRHAEAKTITIRLEHTNAALRIEVGDDGVGIDPDRENHKGLGLRIMEHRCGLMGGTFSARRRKSGGTLIRCDVPMVTTG